MFSNFFKILFRNMVRRKLFSLINISGLTLGITASILIVLFVWDERQYDSFVPDADQIYRVYNKRTSNEGTANVSVTPPMFMTSLLQDFPEVENATRVIVLSEYKALFEVGDKKLYEQNGLYGDSTFFEVFSIPFLSGSSGKSLDDASSIVISSEMAERFFGTIDPVGKRMIIDKTPVEVKGVFKKNPKFHLPFDFLRPLSALHIAKDRMNSWVWQQFYTYVKLQKGADVRSLQVKFQRAVQEKASAELKIGGFSYLPLFQPLRQVHLYSADFKFDLAGRGNIIYVRALTLIAVFILVIACFNFINLATARSLQRAKEVGVRKAIGADKWQLILQFTGEAVLLCAISTVISIVLMFLLLPWLNQFTVKNIPISLLGRPFVILLFLAFVLVMGILSGFYPALVLSAFRPANVLKGTVGAKEPGKIPWLRHTLVLLQFCLSVLLIISIIVVFAQVSYLHHKDLGFSKEQIMFFPMRSDLFKNQQVFKSELLQSPDITSVSIGYGFPGDAVAGDEVIALRNGRLTKQPATQLTVDYDYIKTLQLQIIAGRDFSTEMKSDGDHAWIINETAVKELGFGTPQKAIGQNLYWHPWDGNNPDSLKTGQVIGVVKDFNYKSLYDKVETTVIQIYPGAAWKVAVKLNAANVGPAVAYVKKTWGKFVPDYPIEYKFLDDNFRQMYEAEDRLETLLWIFTGIAVFIGCLGLFGLAAYTAESRLKEVGIRKVLGASTRSLVLLLSGDFLKLVVLSLVIASPIAWMVMHQWLDNFAYRIVISWWMLGIAAALALSIAFLTVAFEAIRAAMTNPVRNLRTD